MIYSVEKINEVSDCDTMLAAANKMKSNLELRVIGLERQIADNSENMSSLPAELANAQQAYNELVAQMATETVVLRHRQLHKKRNEVGKKIRELTERIANYGPVGLIKREQKLDFSNEQLLEVQLYIAAIETRKAELQALVPNAA
jgi:chromosome segregation ATPase